MNLRELRELWLVRIFEKWAWLLGAIPLLTDYLAAYVPSGYMPAFVRSIVDQGIPWSITLAFLTIGLLISAYLVHREDNQRIRSLQVEVQRQSSIGPEIDVNLLFEGKGPKSEIEIPLAPMPTKADIDKLVEEKRSQLLENAEPSGNLQTPIEELGRLAQIAALAAMREPNSDYEEEVEDFIVEYRQYLEIKYDLRVDRAYSLTPYAINLGREPATSVTIEFTMPEEYERPAPHQQIKRDDLDETVLHLYSVPPREPRPYRDRFGIETPGVAASTLMGLFEKPSAPASGPYFEKSHKAWSIAYEVGQLVPKLPEKDLEPFWIWAGDVEPGDQWIIVSRVYAEELPEPHMRHLILTFV